MAADLETPPSAKETNFRAQSMGKWMTGLKDAIPTPSLGAGNAPADLSTQPDPDPAPEPDPQAPANPPAADPATAAPVGPRTADPATAAPAPAAAAPAAAADPNDETRWPRSAKEWKNFTAAQKTKTVQFEKQLQERDAKIKELEARGTPAVAPEVQKQLETLQKENDEYSKQLRLTAVTSHPKFKSYFENRTNTALNQLKAIVPADQLDTVSRLVQAPESENRNEQLDTLLDGMTSLQRGRLLGVINGLDSIRAERDGEIARAQQDYEQMMGQAKAQQEQKQATYARMLEDTVKGMQDAAKGRPEYQQREGETEWNDSVARRIEAGKKLIAGNLAPDVMFKAAFDAAAYPDVLAGYRSALGEVEKLKKQIAAMGAANPTVQTQKPTGASPNAAGSEPRFAKEMRPMDYTKRFIDRFGEALRGESQ